MRCPAAIADVDQSPPGRRRVAPSVTGRLGILGSHNRPRLHLLLRGAAAPKCAIRGECYMDQVVTVALYVCLWTHGGCIELLHGLMIPQAASCLRLPK